jgi:hypothetical protein
LREFGEDGPMAAATAARPPTLRSRPRLRALAAAPPEEVADGVWLLRGDLLKTMNVAQARSSIRKLAELRPAIACPGHLGPLTGPAVVAQLEAAAAA